MENSLYKKGLVLGIIVLFVGAGIVPSISGNIENLYNALSAEGFLGECSSLNDKNSLSTLDYGLVGYWSFGEGNGGTAHDDSGNNNHGTVYGPTWVDGVSGKALWFDGKDDCVKASDSDILDITSDITVMAWVNLNSWNGAIILDKGWNYRLFVIDEGYVCGRMFALGWEGHDIVGTTQVTLQTWHHVAFTWDESMFRCYLDGVEDDSFDSMTPF